MTEQHSQQHKCHGYTISTYFPPQAPWDVVEAYMERVAADAHSIDAGPWDAHVVGHAGDRLHVDVDRSTAAYCGNCPCDDCGGPRSAHYNEQKACACGCNPPCGLFMPPRQIGEISLALLPLMESALADAAAHTAWHVSTGYPTKTEEGGDRE